MTLNIKNKNFRLKFKIAMATKDTKINKLLRIKSLHVKTKINAN